MSNIRCDIFFIYGGLRVKIAIAFFDFKRVWAGILGSFTSLVPCSKLFVFVEQQEILLCCLRFSLFDLVSGVFQLALCTVHFFTTSLPPDIIIWTTLSMLSRSRLLSLTCVSPSMCMAPYWQGMGMTTDASTYSSVEGLIRNALLGRFVSLEFLPVVA